MSEEQGRQSDGEPPVSGVGLDRLASVNLNLLVPLLALLEERSVTRAAARVGLSQPAMSHALARMRRLFGDDLLVREGAETKLTPRALDLIAPLRAVLIQTAGVVNFPDFDPAKDRRVITVGMMTATAFVVGAPLGRLIAERAPNAIFKIRTFTMPTEPEFTEEGVDVVLLSEAFSSPYPRERLYDDRWMLVASPETDPAATPMELVTRERHIVFDAERRVLPYTVLDQLGVGYEIGQLVSDNLLVPHLVARSGGVAFQRGTVAAAMKSVVDLRIEEVPFALPGVGIDMVWNPRLSDHFFIEWLRALLMEVAGQVTAELGPPAPPGGQR
ncbi:LysR family transcriptional regulator [Nocardioides sp.]|uniref:LysR family transcriptional regulator n=1 Tax=Nocardioides sp. TaxID=35761 RepID=UPI002615449C|nr:LysR family transcriptional regulator [Nocardioides sp.]